MTEDQPPASADEARAANEALLTGYWIRAVEALVTQGVPWNDAAGSMLSVAALQVEHALGIDVAERSLGKAAEYMRGKREASEALDKITSSESRH